MIEAPTGIQTYLGDVVLLPRRWVERHVNLQRWTTVHSGGHFGPAQCPGEFVADVRAFFRPLRVGYGDA